MDQVKSAAEVLAEIKELLMNTEEGSAAEVLDEAINEVLDMIEIFEDES